MFNDVSTSPSTKTNGGINLFVVNIQFFLFIFKFKFNECNYLFFIWPKSKILIFYHQYKNISFEQKKQQLYNKRCKNLTPEMNSKWLHASAMQRDGTKEKVVE